MTFTVKWPRWVKVFATLLYPGGFQIWALFLAALSWFSNHEHDAAGVLVGTSIAVAIGSLSYAVARRVRLKIGDAGIVVVNPFRTRKLEPSEILRIGIALGGTRKRYWLPVLGFQTQSGVLRPKACYYQSAATRRSIALAAVEFARRNSIPVTLPTDLSRGWGTHGFMGGLHHRDIGAFSPLWDCFIEKPPAWCGVDRRPSSEPPRTFKQP